MAATTSLASKSPSLQVVEACTLWGWGWGGLSPYHEGDIPCVHWRQSWAFRGRPSVRWILSFLKIYPSIHIIVLFTLPRQVEYLDRLRTYMRCSPWVLESCCADAELAILNIASWRHVLDVCLPWEVNNTLRLDKYWNTCRRVPLSPLLRIGCDLLLVYFRVTGSL